MNNIESSRLYNNETFYYAFEKDLQHAVSFVLIESPFITTRRMETLSPIIRKLRRRGVVIVVNTHNPEEHNHDYAPQAYGAIRTVQDMGVKVLYTVKHHRKLAIVDDAILWEGSLNILSQSDSCEMMRRITSRTAVTELLEFTGVQRWLSR